MRYCYPIRVDGRAADGMPDCVEVCGPRGEAREYGFRLASDSSDGSPADFFPPPSYGIRNLPLSDARREVLGVLARDADGRYPYALVLGIEHATREELIEAGRIGM